VIHSFVLVHSTSYNKTRQHRDYDRTQPHHGNYDNGTTIQHGDNHGTNLCFPWAALSAPHEVALSPGEALHLTLKAEAEELELEVSCGEAVRSSILRAVCWWKAGRAHTPAPFLLQSGHRGCLHPRVR